MPRASKSSTIAETVGLVRVDRRARSVRETRPPRRMMSRTIERLTSRIARLSTFPWTSCCMGVHRWACGTSSRGSVTQDTSWVYEVRQVRYLCKTPRLPEPVSGGISDRCLLGPGRFSQKSAREARPKPGARAPGARHALDVGPVPPFPQPAAHALRSLAYDCASAPHVVTGSIFRDPRARRTRRTRRARRARRARHDELVRRARRGGEEKTCRGFARETRAHL